MWHAQADLAIAFSLLLVAVGCSSKEPAVSTLPRRDAGSSGDPDADPGTRPDPASYARAICAFTEKCELPNFKHRYGDMATCTTKVTALTAAALSAKGNIVTPSELDACIAKLGVTCDDTILDVPECAFKGTVPTGGGCRYSGQCQTASCFRKEATSACGVCTPFGRAAEGCANLECGPGLFCGSGTKCMPTQPKGGACDDLTLLCKPSVTCSGGKCVDYLGKGAACGAKTPACDAGSANLACISGTCQEAAFAKINAACGQTSPNQADCLASSCTDPGSLGACVAFIAEGERCTAATGPECDTGLRCIDGKCRSTDPASCN